MDNPGKLFDDIAKLAQQFKVSSFDMDAVLKGRRKDVEAMLELGRVAQGSAQSLAQKQTEMLRAAVEELRSVLTAPPLASGTQLDAIRKAADAAIGNVGELAQIALQSQSDAFDAVRTRAHANMEELKDLVARAGKS